MMKLRYELIEYHPNTDSEEKLAVSTEFSTIEKRLREIENTLKYRDVRIEVYCEGKERLR